MKRHLLSIALITALCVTLVATEAVRAQDPESILLKEVHATGDVIVVDDETHSVMDARATRNGETIPFELVMSQRERYRDENLPDGVRRHYAVATLYTKNPSGEQDEVRSLQGKTVRVRRVKGKIVVTVDKGKLSSEDHAEIVRLFDTPGKPGRRPSIFLPRPVKVGEEWKVNPKALEVASPGKNSKAEMWLRLEELSTENGKPIARLKVRYDVDGQKPGEPRITAHLEGRLIHRTDIQRTILAEVSGPSTAKGTVQGIRFEGEGTFQAKTRYTVIKLAGKPVP